MPGFGEQARAFPFPSPLWVLNIPSHLRPAPPPPPPTPRTRETGSHLYTAPGSEGTAAASRRHPAACEDRRTHILLTRQRTPRARNHTRQQPEPPHTSSRPSPPRALQSLASGLFLCDISLGGGGLSPLPSGDSPWLNPQWRLILFLVLPLELWGCARDGGGKTRRPSSQQHWRRVLSAPHTLTNSPSRWGPLVPLSQRMAEETEAQRIQATRPFARNLEVMEPGFRPRQAGT